MNLARSLDLRLFVIQKIKFNIISWLTSPSRQNFPTIVLKLKNEKISPFKIFGLKLYRRNPSKCDDLILYWTKVRTQDIIVNIHVVFLFLCLYC